MYIHNKSSEIIKLFLTLCFIINYFYSYLVRQAITKLKLVKYFLEDLIRFPTFIVSFSSFSETFTVCVRYIIK